MALDPRAIRDMSDEEILNEIEDLKEAEFKLRIQKASGQLENVNTLRETRHDIARLKTILHQRHLAAQVANKEGEAKKNA
jgi:large subunit ribosomal protein L29